MSSAFLDRMQVHMNNTNHNDLASYQSDQMKLSNGVHHMRSSQADKFNIGLPNNNTTYGTTSNNSSSYLFIIFVFRMVALRHIDLVAVLRDHLSPSLFSSMRVQWPFALLSQDQGHYPKLYYGQPDNEHDATNAACQRRK